MGVNGGSCRLKMAFPNRISRRPQGHLWEGPARTAQQLRDDVDAVEVLATVEPRDVHSRWLGADPHVPSRAIMNHPSQASATSTNQDPSSPTEWAPTIQASLASGRPSILGGPRSSPPPDEDWRCASTAASQLLHVPDPQCRQPLDP